MKLTTAWADSVRYFFTSSTWRVLGTGFMKAVPLACWFSALLVLATFLSLSGIPVVSPFFKMLLAVMPPLLAIVGSPLYLLPLIRLYDETGRKHCWMPYLKSGIAFYGIGGTLIWSVWQVYINGPAWTTLAIKSTLAVIAPFIIAFLWCSPFVMLAYAYDPTVAWDHARVWRHGRRMAWYELPFIFGLLLLMMPCGAFIYGMPTVLVARGVITAQWWKPLLHIGSVVYWLLGWAVFMVFYQHRKHKFIETRKDAS